MSKEEYTRPQAAELLRRLSERRRFMQVVTGARQVGNPSAQDRLREYLLQAYQADTQEAEEAASS